MQVLCSTSRYASQMDDKRHNFKGKLMKTNLLLLMIILMAFSSFSFAADDDLTIQSLSSSSIDSSAAGWGAAYADVTTTRAGGLPILGERDADTIEIRSAGFVALQGDLAALNSSFLQDQLDDSLIEPKVIDTPLCYPNPFSQNAKTYIQYTLNKNVTIQIQIYDMMANLILKQDYISGAMGGRRGRNVLKFEDIENIKLPVGVYFVFIVTDGKVLAKTKVAVIP